MVASANVHCQHCYLYHPSCLRMEGESPALQFTSSWKDILSLCTSAFKGNPGTKRACSFKRGSSIEIKKRLAKKKDYFIETLLNHCLKTCPVQLKKKITVSWLLGLLNGFSSKSPQDMNTFTYQEWMSSSHLFSMRWYHQRDTVGRG